MNADPSGGFDIPKRALGEIVRGHMPALDGLRGVAILLVMAHAFNVVQDDGKLTAATELLFNTGWIGVQLFFVLSGFLITGILLDTKARPGWYRSFIVSRALRIFPLYFGVLVVAFLLLPLLLRMPPGYGDHQQWLWTFSENYASPFGGQEVAFPHFWSLCVEEQFYLVWPLLVLVCGLRGTVIASAFLILVSIASRIYIRQRFGDPIGPAAAYVFTPCRMDALAIGAIAASLVRSERFARRIEACPPALPFWSGIVLVLAGLLLGQLWRIGPQMQGGGYTLIAVGFAMTLVGVLRSDPAVAAARWLAMASLRRVGKYSYGMYVFHMPLHVFVGLPLLACWFPAPGLLAAIAYLLLAFLVTFALAALSYHAYERRFLNLKPPRAARIAG